MLLPTAYTHPAGTIYIASYDVAILQVGYAFTDQSQITLTAVPIGSESITLLDLSLKTSVFRGGLVRAAALGSASGAVGKDIGILFIGRVGGVVQLCLQRACDGSFSLSSNGVLAGPVVLMANGVGGIFRVGRRVSLLGELATLLPLGTQGTQINGGTAGGGVRLHYQHWGFDFTLLKSLGRTTPAIPLLTATYRSSP
jgi:hypothetical protein